MGAYTKHGIEWLAANGHLPDDAVPIDGQNVHDYVMSTGGWPSGLTRLELPVTPPWPTSAVQFKNVRGQTYTVVTFHLDISPSDTFPTHLIGVSDEVVQSLPLHATSAIYELTWGFGRVRQGLFMVSRTFLDSDGRILVSEMKNAHEHDAFGGAPYVVQDFDIRKRQGEASASVNYALLTFAFCHCRNVSVETHRPAPKVARKRRKQGKPPGITYKTLVIDGMKEVLRTEGNVEKNGLKKALHICRGHFATYTEDKPLFGKVTGTFWKPMHTRGSKKRGEVRKDYKVVADGTKGH